MGGKHMLTINALFSTASERFGNRIALIEPIEGARMSTLTYHTALERVRGFAGYLQQLHIEKGDCLLIWSPSRSDWLIAYLGALLVGAVIVPLDVNSKEDFLLRVAELTDTKLLITTQKQFAGLKQTSLPLVDLDALPQATMDAAKLPEIHENDLAEVVFTSGTTGQPKGVILSHRNIASNATAAAT
ncbi:MAG: acyl--CoA ligase, partial [Chloroflexi bacterium]